MITGTLEITKLKLKPGDVVAVRVLHNRRMTPGVIAEIKRQLAKDLPPKVHCIVYDADWIEIKIQTPVQMPLF